jgi:rhamnosyltransferase
VYVGADALPGDEYWLRNLVAGFADAETAGVYGRQRARDSAYPMEEFYLTYMYGDTRREQRWNGGDITLDTTWFSNANSAIRRDVWQQFPFSETVLFGEDQEWSLRVLRAGYKIEYAPEAAVVHSHNYSLVKAFRRWFNSGISSYETYMPTEKRRGAFFVHRGLSYLAQELRFLIARRYIRWVPFAFLYEAAKFGGLIAGRFSRLLPERLTSRLLLKY